MSDTKAVDVRAVLENIAEETRGAIGWPGCRELAARLDEVHAAIAELIEADLALDAANRVLTETDPQSEDAETMRSMRAHRDRMVARRRKALSACGGSQ